MTREPAQPTQRPRSWSCDSTEALGIALLRLETARELALVRRRSAEGPTLERWIELERKVEQGLDECERRLARLGEAAVPAAVAGIRALELEVCELIGARGSSGRFSSSCLARSSRTGTLPPERRRTQRAAFAGMRR